MHFGGGSKMGNSQPKLKLTYFGLRGRGEASRWLLAYAGAEYEDHRIAFEQWPELKPKTPCGGLPVLNVNGTEVAQSVAVARYVAREFKLDGKNNVEKAQGDMIVDCITDAFLEFLKEKFGKENNFKDEFYPKWLVMMDKLLTKNGGKHFVGKEITWADIMFAALMNDILVSAATAKWGETVVFGEHKCLQDLYHCVMNTPSIKKWVEKRPQTDA